jgi:PAS domain S-box-containing protein
MSMCADDAGGSPSQGDWLVHIASRIGRFGGWAVELPERRVVISPEMREVLELPNGGAPAIDDLFSFVVPEQCAVLTDLLHRCIDDGVPFDTECEAVTASGRRLWIRAMGKAERDANGAVRSVHGAIQDITGLKRADDEVARLATRLSDTLDSITDGFVTVDRQWRFTYLNSSAEKMLGRRRTELLGAVLWDVIPGLRESAFGTACLQAVQSGVSATVEDRFDPLGGWFEVRVFPSPDGLALYVRDVTEAREARETVQRSEARFRLLADTMPQIVWIASPDGESIYSNQRWIEYSGRTLEESSGSGWVESYHPDDRELVFRKWREATETLQGLEVTCRLRRQDGAWRWFLVRAAPVIDSQGKATMWLGTGTDVDDLHQAWGRIAEQAQIIDSANDAIIVRDLDDRIVSWNLGAERLYGWSAAEAVGRPFYELLDVSAAAVAPALRTLRQYGQWKGEIEKRKRDGSVVAVEGRWTLVRNDRDEPQAIVAIDTDITDRTLAELRLRESEERYRLLFDRNPHPMWVYDIDSMRFLAVSETALRLYGYSREEFSSMTILDIRLPEEKESTLRALEEARKGEAPRISGMFRHRTKEGKVIDVEIRSSGIPFAGHRARLVLALDVSERKALEQQFLRAQRMESIGTLAGGIAHDLNNLLMPIMMGVTLLRREGVSDRAQRALDNIEKSAQRGRDLVSQVLSFSRGVAGSREPVNVSTVVDDIRAIVESTFPKNITLTVDVASDLWWIAADPTQIHQVLLNLSVNARDAMPEGGRLRIAARNVDVDPQYAETTRGLTVGRHVLLEVSDEGVGMRSEIVDRIFEPFFTTKERGRGSGLGLSTVAAIVRSHEGMVNVQSEPGRGSTFRVYLPAERDTRTATAAQAQLRREPPRGHGELILVVDDEKPILAVTEQALHAFGYEVLVAEDGAQAIAQYALRRSGIAAVITDMMMPVMDGSALIAALRSIDPNVVIIASSGLHDGIRLPQTGVARFLPKPYSAEVLLETLAEVLHPAGGPGETS